MSGGQRSRWSCSHGARSKTSFGHDGIEDEARAGRVVVGEDDERVRRVGRPELADDVPRRALGEPRAQPARRAALEVLGHDARGDGADEAGGAHAAQDRDPRQRGRAAGTPIGAK